MKVTILSIIIVSLTMLSFFSNKMQNINKDFIASSLIDNNVIDGNKTFNEVRIIRTKLAKDVFTDVITKYQYKDDPCPPKDTTIDEMSNKINILINKYSI